MQVFCVEGVSSPPEGFVTVRCSDFCLVSCILPTSKLIKASVLFVVRCKLSSCFDILSRLVIKSLTSAYHKFAAFVDEGECLAVSSFFENAFLKNNAMSPGPGNGGMEQLAFGNVSMLLLLRIRPAFGAMVFEIQI